MDRRKLEARLNLARHFFIHMARRAFSHEDTDGVGLNQFLSHYRADNIFEIDEREREHYHTFARCIQCNICQPYCVMYRAVNQHEFPGPMLVASTLSRGISELGTTRGVIYNCTLCRLCETTCPENAPIAEIVNFVRKYIYKYEPGLVPQPLKELCSAVRKQGAIFEGTPFGIKEKKSAEYVLFLGCHSRFKQTKRTEAAISMLTQLGIDFTTIDEVCCGAPLAAAGHEDSLEFTRLNIERIREKNTAKVITLCPHCLVTFCEEEEYESKLEAIYITELLSQVRPGSPRNETVAYHDPCMLGRVCGIYDEPREAIRRTGASLVELKANREMSYCCGNWGGLGQSAPDTAKTIAARRLGDAMEAGAEVLLTECPWCLEIFESTPAREGEPRVSSVIEYLLDGKA